MGINRIVNVLVLLTAIGAIVLAFILFDKREGIVAGRNTMAKVISEKTAILAEKSMETPAALNPADMDVTKTQAEVVAALQKFSDATDAIITQRDELARDVLLLTAILAEDEVKDNKLGDLDSERVADASTHADEIKKIHNRAREVIARFQAVRKAYVEAFQSLEKILKISDENKLKIANPENPTAADIASIRERMGKYTEEVKALYRHVKAVQEKIPADVGAMPVDVADGKYEDGLRAQLAALDQWAVKYKGLQDKVKELEEKVAELEQKVADLEAEVEKQKKEVERLKNEIVTLEEGYKKLIEEKDKEIKELKEKGLAASATPQPDAETPAAPQPEVKLPVNMQALREMQARVVFVDATSGLVVLDFGTKSKIKIKGADGKETEVPLVVPDRAILTVATSLDKNPKFVCKVQVYNITEKQAFANIMVGGDIPKVGDVAYFSGSDIEILPAPEAAK